MVCPVCITSAIIASAPSVVAGIGGIAAVKLAVNRARCVKLSKSEGIHESLREGRDRQLRPEPVRIEAQEKWRLPNYQRWDDDA